VYGCSAAGVFDWECRAGDVPEAALRSGWPVQDAMGALLRFRSEDAGERKLPMKRRGLALMVLAILSGVGCALYGQTKTKSMPAANPRASASETVAAQNGSPQTFSGEIMDSICAAKGSHDGMMKQQNAKDAKECTLNCVDHGARFVLYDPVTKTTYQLSDQSKAKDYAGQNVKITGTPDRTTNTINIESIDAA
jgi:hypothetical protein